MKLPKCTTRAVVCLFLAVALFPACAVERGPVGLDALEQLDKLPYLWAGREARHTSSHQLTGQNDDYSSFLYSYTNAQDSSKTDQVMLHEKGAGCIYRIWMTNMISPSTTPILEGDLKIYVDGKLVVDASLAKTTPTDTSFFSGSFATNTSGESAYPYPLVGDWGQSSGGFYSYVPIPYKSECKVVRVFPTSDINARDSNNKLIHRFYYNISYIAYDSADGVVAYTGNEQDDPAYMTKLNRIKNRWLSAGVDPKPIPSTPPIKNSIPITIPAKVQGQASPWIKVCEISGPKCINGIRFSNVFYSNHPEWINANIRITFDNHSTPDVLTTWGRFFGGDYYRPFAEDPNSKDGTFDNSIKGLLFGTQYDAIDPTRNWDYNFYPMPFHTKAVIEVQNNYTWEYIKLSYEIFASDMPDAKRLFGSGQIGYFRSSQTLNDVYHTYYQDYSLLNTVGRGTVVGYVYAPAGGSNASRWHLEGDERIHTDDSRTPAIYGTGTEDTFNCGWYFKTGLTSRPTHGFTARFGSPDRRSMYRLLLGDTIPFNRNVKFGMECGGQNGDAGSTERTDISGAYMYSTVYYYAADNVPSIVSPDLLDVGNTANENAHGYQRSAGNLYTLYDRTLKFEGDNDTVGVRDLGRHFQGGYSTFNLAIPADNYGVKLRRLSYYSVANQEALVSVWDDAEQKYLPVGTWFDAGSNTTLMWRDSDFYLPASFTQGKTLLKIKIDSANQWTEYSYSAYPYKSPAIPVSALSPSPVVADDGISTSSLSSLHFTWTKPDEPVWGITAYQYAIGTTPYGTDVRGWTDAGMAMSCDATNLPLVEGKTYYISLKAKNGAGVWGNIGTSNGIFVPTSCSIATAKGMADNSGCVALRGYTVTAVFSGHFYIEDSQRNSGIRVNSSVGVAVGEVVDVSGTLAIVDRERQINADSVTVR